MEAKYFKLCYSLNGEERKIINPTYICCPKELAEKYGEALTICNKLQGGNGNKFWFKEVEPVHKPSVLDTRQVREEIFYEFDRAYAYLADRDGVIDFDEYDRKGIVAANKLIGDDLNKKIDDFLRKQQKQNIR